MIKVLQSQIEEKLEKIEKIVGREYKLTLLAKYHGPEKGKDLDILLTTDTRENMVAVIDRFFPPGSGSRWSTEEPTVPGWYWIRAPQLSARIVQFRPCQWNEKPVCDYYDVLCLHGRPYEYAGPIPSPNDEITRELERENRNLRRALKLARQWGIRSDGFSAEVSNALRRWMDNDMKGAPPDPPDYYPQNAKRSEEPTT